jgi:hypothetical protein
MSYYKTLKLDTSTWDLMLDGQGNIAIATDSEAVAQDVASACLVFYGECYFDNTWVFRGNRTFWANRPRRGISRRRCRPKPKSWRLWIRLWRCFL